MQLLPEGCFTYLKIASHQMRVYLKVARISFNAGRILLYESNIFSIGTFVSFSGMYRDDSTIRPSNALF